MHPPHLPGAHARGGEAGRRGARGQAGGGARVGERAQAGTRRCPAPPSCCCMACVGGQAAGAVCCPRSSVEVVLLMCMSSESQRHCGCSSCYCQSQRACSLRARSVHRVIRAASLLSSGRWHKWSLHRRCCTTLPTWRSWRRSRRLGREGPAGEAVEQRWRRCLACWRGGSGAGSGDGRCAEDSQAEIFIGCL